MMSFEARWRQRFTRYGACHEAEHLVSGWSVAGLRQRVATFERLLDEGWLRAGASVLELGCGAGTYVRLLGKRGHPVIGLDYSLPSLARAAAADRSRPGGYLAGDAYALPFRAGRFGAVMCIGVLQAVEEPTRVLVEIARVLEPGGVVLVETLNPWNLVAAARRLSAWAQRQPTRLRYGAPGDIERLMREHGIRPQTRAAILLPPRSLPGLAAVLRHPLADRLARIVPGVRSSLCHAFWITGVRA